MILRAIGLAFSTFSRIPMPVMKNEEKIKKARSYTLCFFPLVGLVIGALWFLWMIMADMFAFNNVLTAAGSTVLPILVTGGIHMDGFCDVTDAFSSWQTRERRLEILKDPHVGAFAIIGCIVYFISYFGIMSTIRFNEVVPVFACTFIISRALSSLASVCFKNARPGGMLDSFSSVSTKKSVVISSAVYMIIAIVIMSFADWRLAIVSVITSLLVLLWYRIISYKRLGGITGDTAGWFVEVTELAAAVTVCIAAGIFY